MKRKPVMLSEKTHKRLVNRKFGMMSMDDVINEILDRLENVEDLLFSDEDSDEEDEGYGGEGG